MHEFLGIVPTLTFRKVINLLKNYLSYLLSRISKRPIVWGLPSFLSLEPTNYCNLRCPECPSGNGQLSRARGYISTDLSDKILKTTSKHLSYLQLFLQGEPFMHSGIATITRQATQRGIYTCLSTNAHHLTQGNVEKIMDAGFHKIIISLDGLTQQTYEAYRKGGDLSKVLSGLENLLFAKTQKHSAYPFIEVQFLVFSHNEHEMALMKDFANRQGIDKLSFKKAQIYDATKKRALIPKNKRFARYDKQTGNLLRKPTSKGACSRLWTTLVVTWEGTMIPCCYDKNATWGIKKNREFSLSKWKSQHFTHFREVLLRNRTAIEMCNNCPE